MIFNGIEREFVSVIQGRVLPFFAPLNRTFRRFNSRQLKTERGIRMISVPLFIKHNGYSHYQKLKEEISDWLVHDEPKKLEFKDDPERFYWAVVDGEITEDAIYEHGAEITVTFACGYKYGEDKTIAVNGNANTNIGGQMPVEWETETIFTENVLQYEFQFNELGKSELRDINKIKINYEFKSGDRLIVNYSRRKITVNGKDITNALVILQSNFIKMPVGPIELSTTYKTTIHYNEVYN